MGNSQDTTRNGIDPSTIRDIPPNMDGEAAGPGESMPFSRSDMRLTADPTRPLEDRLETFEDLFDSEVGDTLLTRSRNIERFVDLRQIHVKFEGGNPTGAQKDRIAFAQAMDALRRGFEAITLATCGNYGVAMALAASIAGLRCVVHIPERYRAHRLKEMHDLGAEVLRVPGDYEQAVQSSRDHADREGLYDANPGGANTSIQLRAYGEIAREIYDELKDAPAAVAVPVSNGTTLAGIHRGFLSLYRRGKTSRMPRMVAGSSHRKNPIVHAFLAGNPRCEDLAPERIRESKVNEPLVNWHAIDGDAALDALLGTRGWAAHATDRNMLACARILREQEGLNVLPASTAGMIALMDLNRKDPLPPDRYVVVLTGRKS